MADITITDLGLMGMITLRGDHTAIKTICTQITGVAFPAIGRIEAEGNNALAWMSLDEVLVMVPHAKVAAALAKVTQALQGVHHLAVDVSDARALFAVSGPYASEVIAKLAPVDMHPDHCGPGQFRRSRLGQVAAAFWMTPDRAIHVICFRSVADYVAALLDQSARDGAVGFFTLPQPAPFPQAPDSA